MFPSPVRTEFFHISCSAGENSFSHHGAAAESKGYCIPFAADALQFYKAQLPPSAAGCFGSAMTHI